MGQKLTFPEVPPADEKMDQELSAEARLAAMNRTVADLYIVWTVVYKQTGYLSKEDFPKMAETFWPLRRLCTDILAGDIREQWKPGRPQSFVSSDKLYLRGNDPKKYAVEMRARRRKMADRPKATRNGAAAYSRKRNQRNIFERMLPAFSKGDAPEAAAWYSAKHHIYRTAPPSRFLDYLVRRGDISAQFRRAFEAALASAYTNEKRGK